MNTIANVIAPYFFVLVFLCSAFGLGKAIFDSLPAIWKDNQLAVVGDLRAPTEVSLGMAFFILASILLFEFGLYSKAAIYIVLVSGLIYFIIKILKTIKLEINFDFALACALILFSSTLVAPLTLPLEWDELMYHLPHAKAWAENGSLSINENLRYPYFPYNINVLYAGAFALGLDQMPHFIHASFGWITGWLIFCVASRWHSRYAATAATSVWFIVSANYYKNAYIDLGLTLFVFISFVYFMEWIRTKSHFALVLSSLFFGFALGAKYQAILFALPLLLLLIFKRVTARELAISMLCLSVGSAYWYVRNFVLTGNPVNPMAGWLFGYHDWTPQDVVGQFSDLERVRESPVAAALAILVIAANYAYIRKKKNEQDKFMALYCLFVLTAWIAFSGYSRYLLPAAPVILILIGQAMVNMVTATNFGAPSVSVFIQKSGLTLLILIGIVQSISANIRWSKRVGFDDERVVKISKSRVAGYSAWRYLGATQRKIYQFKLEGSLYYAPKSVYGDHFGPWRYSDYVNLNGEELHKKLKLNSFEILVVASSGTGVVATVDAYPSGFEKLFSSQDAYVYEIK